MATAPSITPVNTSTGSSGTSTGSSSTGTAQPASSNVQTTTVNPVSGSHNIWSELVFAFIGTAALAVIANMNDALGRVLLAIMVGFLFMWLLLHAGTIAGWINQAVPQTQSD